MCSDALMEASHAAMRAGRERLALNRARRAAEAAPIRPAPVVLARMLEYRVRGAGTADEARATIAAIDQVSQEPSSEEAAILAFVRAEALAAIPDAGSGLAALRDCEAVHGLHALLSLGIAERLLTVGDFEGALAGFQAALAGDLCAVRDRGRVALAAAETAIRAGSPDAALTLFQDAAGSVGLRTTALLRAAQLVLQRGDISRARGILGELATSTVGDDQARVLAELARLERESADSAERVHAAETFERAVAAASAGGPLAAELAMERDALARPASQPWVMGSLSAPSYAQAGPSSLSVPVLAGIALAAPAEVGEREPAPGGAGAVSFESVIAAPVEVLPEPTVPAVEATGPTPAPAPLVEGPFEVEPPADATPPAATSPPSQVVVSPADGRVAPPATPELPRTVEDLRRMVEAGGKPEEISLARVALARAYLDQGARDAAQSCLETGLEGGGVAEGEMLASLLESAGRRAEVVRVRRSLVALRPGESQLIDALGAAAAADANAPYAQAIEHVARVVDAASTPASPPPLGAQVALPGFLAFLTRAAADRAAQALALVWEDGHSVWSKEASGVLQGTQSISAVGGPAVALYERAIALLSLPRVPIFVRPSSEAPTARVALMWPAAGVVTGRVDEDTAAVRLTVGRALAVALPANALPLGLVDANARYAFRAVMGAFGPPESSRSMDRESGRLAEALWHVLPPRTQRKLQAMLTTVQLDDFEAVPARSLRCVERVGLFLAGDFEASVRSVLGERSRASGGPPPDLRQIDWCAVCRDDPTIRDLFFFALSPEYAEARWHAPSSESRRASSRPDAP
jgi:tetratricopeptide (TPR) repeat protein